MHWGYDNSELLSLGELNTYSLCCVPASTVGNDDINATGMCTQDINENTSKNIMRCARVSLSSKYQTSQDEVGLHALN